jgi:hypothetical protein
MRAYAAMLSDLRDHNPNRPLASSLLDRCGTDPARTKGVVMTCGRFSALLISPTGTSIGPTGMPDREGEHHPSHSHIHVVRIAARATSTLRWIASFL